MKNNKSSFSCNLPSQKLLKNFALNETRWINRWRKTQTWDVYRTKRLINKPYFIHHPPVDWGNHKRGSRYLFTHSKTFMLLNSHRLTGKEKSIQFLLCLAIEQASLSCLTSNDCCFSNRNDGCVIFKGSLFIGG